MNPDTTLPMDWKPLREAAEIDAQVVHNLFAFLTWGVTGGWSELDDDAQDTLVRVQATLLSDLTRPASRDFWARWLAAKVGLEVGATAPHWRQTTGSLGGWVLIAEDRARSCFEFTTRAAHAGRGNIPATRTMLVVQLLGLTNPAAALRAALLAVEPA